MSVKPELAQTVAAQHLFDAALSEWQGRFAQYVAGEASEETLKSARGRCHTALDKLLNAQSDGLRLALTMHQVLPHRKAG